MPNHWMDQIKALYDEYYADKITQLQLVNKIEQVMVDYNTLDGVNYSDYNSIKDNIHAKLRSGNQ